MVPIDAINQITIRGFKLHKWTSRIEGQIQGIELRVNDRHRVREHYLGRDSYEGCEQVDGGSAVGGDGGGKDGERVVGGATRGALKPGEDEHVHEGERDLHRLGLGSAPEAERAVDEQLHQRARAHPRGRQHQVARHQPRPDAGARRRWRGRGHGGGWGRGGWQGYGRARARLERGDLLAGISFWRLLNAF